MWNRGTGGRSRDRGFGGNSREPGSGPQIKQESPKGSQSCRGEKSQLHNSVKSQQNRGGLHGERGLWGQVTKTRQGRGC